MYSNILDTVVMFLILNAREQIIRQNVYVRKILKHGRAVTNIIAGTTIAITAL